MVSDLHRLVTFAAPQERPLLLVGSELGALVVRAFAHLHPQVPIFTREESTDTNTKDGILERHF
jgi:hypothetical protein